MYDVVVIGGGAAGMMAAGWAAKNGSKVLLVEKMEKLGRKVRISGKGRCNITNSCTPEEFVERLRTGHDFFRPAFKAFNNRSAVRFFERMGVRTIEEQGGRIFPKSGNAWDVADALMYWCRDNEVEIQLNTKVTNILTAAGRIYGVEFENKRGFRRRVEARNVIIATGGVTYPLTGSTGDGYDFADRAGHTIVPLRPSLVPLVPDVKNIDVLVGLKLKNVSVDLMVGGKCAATEFGEMSFSARGVEGAVVLRLSRDAVDALCDDKKVALKIDLKPALTPETIKARIERERGDLPSDAYFGDLLRRLAPPQLVMYIAGWLGIPTTTYLSKITDKQVALLIDTLKCLIIPIADFRPMSEAIVTAGGVSTDEIDPESMQSRKVKGLYFAGEVLDLDGNTGGFNLQIAFSTGYLAGQLKTTSL